MKRDKKFWATAIGVVCGIELLLAALVGGAGLSAFFGLEGLFVGIVIAGAAIGYLLLRRQRRTNATVNN